MRTVDLSREAVRLIDQRRLPNEMVVMECRDYHAVGEAIKTLAVRGAPAIGVTAAGGLALAAQALKDRPAADFWSGLENAAAELRSTRPTAVNLFWAIQKVMDFAATQKGRPTGDVAEALFHFALGMAEEDVAVNKQMAEYGQELVKDGDGILTHCNTGSLATVDWGTALGVIRMAHEKGKNIHVYVDETRPVLQGSRLTAWECVHFGIPATLITDNMAAHMMRLGKINICFVGADRIAANGDTANKIGTYGVSVLAREHGIPFYVVAPSSTVDLAIESGAEIEIEERKHEEVTHIGGVRIAPEGIGVANPAFDVTPAKYITGIITEAGIVYPPFRVNLQRLLRGGK
ncbi:MAG TPA: S-methyl-5-thioribose-1-phosphate isomerase [Symbiobacteriaceae bacterium]|jgi:methylthioribose-1-phosphate isomerase|nr:S-methyl-5-thioribose-1-phosphate isomerase [Symbiobacteriaceae bacterium]